MKIIAWILDHGADIHKLLKVGLVGLCYQAQQKSIVPWCDSTFIRLVLSPISWISSPDVVKIFRQNLILAHQDEPSTLLSGDFFGGHGPS